MSVRFVTAEEIEREKRDLRAFRRTFDVALRRQYQINRNRERWVRRVARLEADLEALRWIGWARLRAADRRYYRRLSDRLIPEARERLEYWTKDLERHFEEVLKPLREQIRDLEKAIGEKVLPRLYRVKIRLYAVKRRREYYLTFQGFFDIDAILDPETGLPVWDWWFTQMEIRDAKFHFHGYWKGGIERPKAFTPAEIGQAYLTDYTGISTREYRERTPEFKYTKRVPEDYLRIARRMTLEEIIIGISNIQPRPTAEPEGVFFEYAMIIDEKGNIKWMDKRDTWAKEYPDDIIRKVKEELGLE